VITSELNCTGRNDKSPAPSLRAINLRGYARVMFNQGQSESGRRLFEESLTLNLPDTDHTRSLRADTLVGWATTERDHGFEDEGERRYQQALAEARRIGTVSRREEVTNYVESLWRTDPKEVAGVITPSAEPGRLPPR
jgi:hypothetical protein